MTIDVNEVKRRLKALLNDNNLVNEYIRLYGPTIDIKNIKGLKERTAKSSRTESDEEGEDPIYEVEVTCPICNQANVKVYDQRSKSQQLVMNKFQIPNYVGTSGYKSVDYTLLYTTVCPRCLFASPDKKDFIRNSATGTGAPLKSQLTSNIIMTLQEKIGERKALLKSVTDYEGYFSRPRTDEAAIHSIRLSMMRANVEAWYEQPYSYFKLGSYALRIAKIMKDIGLDNRETLREALSFFEEAFRTSNCPGEEVEMQVIYTLVALHLKLEDPKKANSYIAVFSNLKNQREAEMRETPGLTATSIVKWEALAKRLWEDREQEDLFENE